jgi:hypothetical protein
LLALFTVAISCVAFAADVSDGTPVLDHGFQLLYRLDFGRAEQLFSGYQRDNPEDPLGPVSEAAGWLFSEFHRLGVLEAQFYEDDSIFAARKKLVPDQAVQEKFEAALDRTELLAQKKLARDSRDHSALFAMTLASGLRADFAALIEKHNLTSLHYTKEATGWAEQLLAVDPGCYDAHVATGISNYLVGSMAAPVRWVLRMGGVPADKAAGIRELQMTASYGHYLAPFAKILLAIAYVRENDKARALDLLAALNRDYPENPLFAKEIARLDSSKAR